jgi:hypothetical protein
MQSKLIVTLPDVIGQMGSGNVAPANHIASKNL